MFLVGTFLAMAGLFALLYAWFLVVIQVLVYAGAIMVLFVFVVMILNKEEEEPWALRWASSARGSLAPPSPTPLPHRVGAERAQGHPRAGADGAGLRLDRLDGAGPCSRPALPVRGGVDRPAHRRGRRAGVGIPATPTSARRRLIHDLFNVSTGHYLALAAVLLDRRGRALLRRNALIVLMSVELMLNAANLTLIAFARQRDGAGHDGHRCRRRGSCGRLAIVVGLFRATRHANIDRLTSLKY